MDNKTFRDEVYKKYDYYKNIKNDEFFNSHHYKTNKKYTIVTKVAAILVVGILTTGIVYATSYYVQKVWKQPKKVSWKESHTITEEEEQKSLSEEEAIQKAKDIIKNLNKTVGNVEKAELNKNAGLTSSPNNLTWNIYMDNKISVSINSQTGKLIHISDFSIDDTKIPSTMSKNEIEKVAKEIYHSLGYTDDIYSLHTLSKSYITNDTNYWTADFCKCYDGLYNDYECVRISFIPEIKQLSTLVLFDTKTENNEVLIPKETAIEIAKAKANKIKNGKGTIKSITAKLDFKKMNSMFYEDEDKPKNQNTENTVIVSIDDGYFYQVEDLVRKVWVVEIEYVNNLYADKYYFYVDCTTGEIIGGDQMK